MSFSIDQTIVGRTADVERGKTVTLEWQAGGGTLSDVTVTMHGEIPPQLLVN